jgi:hypothetical protein
MGLEFLRNEISRMRAQILRQRREIQQLHRAGINTLPAESLLARMQDKVDNLCAERDKLVGETRRKYPGTNKVIKGTPPSPADEWLSTTGNRQRVASTGLRYANATIGMFFVGMAAMAFSLCPAAMSWWRGVGILRFASLAFGIFTFYLLWNYPKLLLFGWKSSILLPWVIAWFCTYHAIQNRPLPKSN